MFGSALSIAVVLLVFAGLGLIAYELFGVQALGLPAILGAAALFGLLELVSDAGLGNVGVVLVAGGVIAIPLVIGMAMRLGADPGTRADTSEDTPDERSQSRRIAPPRRDT
jgi:hypothetical protein